MIKIMTMKYKVDKEWKEEFSKNEAGVGLVAWKFQGVINYWSQESRGSKLERQEVEVRKVRCLQLILQGTSTIIVSVINILEFQAIGTLSQLLISAVVSLGRVPDNS